SIDRPRSARKKTAHRGTRGFSEQCKIAQRGHRHAEAITGTIRLLCKVAPSAPDGLNLPGALGSAPTLLDAMRTSGACSHCDMLPFDRAILQMKFHDILEIADLTFGSQ